MTHLKMVSYLLVGMVVLANLPASAATRKPAKPVSAKPQIPFSFIAPSLPNQTLARLQSTLQGRIVEERQAPPAEPIYTQLYQTAPSPSEQPAISTSTTESIAPSTTQPVTTLAVDPTPKAKQVRLFKPDYPQRSWVSDLTAPQAIPLAANIADFLAQQFDPKTTTLLLAQPGKKQLNNPLTPELESQLRQAGFTLAASRAEAPKAHLVQYQINGVGNGILVQLQTRHQWISRYYQLTPAQALMATHPFSIRTLGDKTP